MSNKLNTVYKVLTAACAVILLVQWIMNQGMVVSPKAESTLQQAYDFANWLRLVVSLFR